jgi:HK97 gp10 family phage protein
MGDTVRIKFTGFEQFQATMRELQDDFGPQDQKKILTKAVRRSMNPVLQKARGLAPVDTGALKASLRIEARKPSRKDKKSIYVSPSDVVIGTVTTAPGNVLKKKSFFNVKTKTKQVGIASDARAIANEFGTAKMPAKPFMRPAMESSTFQVLNELGEQLKTEIFKYRVK